VDHLSISQLISSPDRRSWSAGQAPVHSSGDRKWEALLQTGRIPKDAETNTEFMKFLCRQLEAVSINTLFQAARKTVPEDGPLSGGFAGSMYQGLVDEEYSRMIASRGGFGLGDALFNQMMARQAYARGAAGFHAPAPPQEAPVQALTQNNTPETSPEAPQGAAGGSDN
jgi:Rod binding domain-containing protein